MIAEGVADEKVQHDGIHSAVTANIVTVFTYA
jgi:hypothetical protein